MQYHLAPDLRIQRLYQDEMVAVARKDHPLAGRRATPERLASCPYVAVATQPAKLEELTKTRRRLAPSRIVPSFLAAASLVRESDAYTHLPARLAVVVLDAFGLQRLAATAAPAKIAIAQAWTARLDNDAGHAWLRGCVRRAAAGRG